MMTCKVFSRILFVLLLISTVAALALYVYGTVSFLGTELSVMTSIDMLIGIVDTDSSKGFASVYNSVAGAFVGLAYILMLVALIKKVIRMFKHIRKIFSEKNCDSFAKNFSYAIETNISVFFCVLIFAFIAATALGTVVYDSVTYIFVINLVFLAFAVFFNSKFLTSELKEGSTGYSIFNSIRAFVMIIGVALALDYIANSSSFMSIIYNIGTICQIDGDFGGSGRYNLYCYYSFLIEPVIIFIASITVIKRLNKIAKNQDNSIKDYNDAANSLTHLLTFSLVMMVCRIVMVIFCGSAQSNLEWSAKLVKYIFSLIKHDLVPFALITGGLLILNNGMPGIEYNGKGKVKELYR